MLNTRVLSAISKASLMLNARMSDGALTLGIKSFFPLLKKISWTFSSKVKIRPKQGFSNKTGNFMKQ